MSVPKEKYNCAVALFAKRLVPDTGGFRSITDILLRGYLHKTNISTKHRCKKDENTQKNGVQEAEGTNCYECSRTMP